MTMMNRPGPRNQLLQPLATPTAQERRLPPLWPLSLSPRSCLGYRAVTEEARGFGRTGNGLFSDPDKMLTVCHETIFCPEILFTCFFP